MAFNNDLGYVTGDGRFVRGDEADLASFPDLEFPEGFFDYDFVPIDEASLGQQAQMMLSDVAALPAQNFDAGFGQQLNMPGGY